MKLTIKYLSLLLLVLSTYNLHGQSRSAIIAIEVPQIEDDDIFQTINYKLPFALKSNVSLSCYQVRKEDTIRLYDFIFDNTSFKEGVGTIDLHFTKTRSIKYQDNTFLNVIEKYKEMPPGIYKTVFTISYPDSNFYLQKEYFFDIDSILSYNSNLRNGLNASLEQASPKSLSNNVKNKLQNSNTEKVKRDNKRLTNKVTRELNKSSGVTTNTEIIDGINYVGLYYEGWFLGRYPMKEDENINDRLLKENEALSENASSLVKNSLGGFTSIGSQIKKLYKKKNKKDDDEIKGMIDLRGSFSNGQEPGSEQDNNFEEVRGQIETKILGMPVMVDGYYTTQDQHRKAKASYIRLHYDVDKAKSELAEMTNGYKNKYGETVAKGRGITAIYEGYVNNLSAQKSNITKEIGKEYGIDANTLKNYKGNITDLVDTSGLIKEGIAKVGSEIGKDSSASEKREKIRNRKEKLRKKYEQLQAAEAKIIKYKILLDQYRSQNYLDSSLNYSKIEKLSDGDEVTYKQMAKAAIGLLPKGKVSNFLTGITNFDIGIINKYESDYTISGQTIKGGSIGYDFGFVRAGATIGKTEYASRNGEMDRYSSYMGRLDFKPFFKQKLALIYYLYSPSKQMLDDNSFFKSTDVAVPTFKQPTHIAALTYNGAISKYVTMNEEAALSYKNGTIEQWVSMDNMALKSSIDVNIPRISSMIRAEWEHMGKRFENNAMPYSKAATERYTIETSADVFRSFLSIGVQYNYVKQENFASKGYNTKWGFDLKTHSKRWPSIAISYKPFSTFRSYADTLNIPQRPMVGAVCVARASYQVRKKNIVHRFTLTFNQNTSDMDTVHYSSKTLQASYILSAKRGVIMVNGGWMSLPVSQVQSDYISNSYFVSTSVSGKVNERFNLSIGEDVSIAPFGLQRFATSIGPQYIFKKFPLDLKLQLRISEYKQVAGTAFRNLTSGQIGINYRFKTNVVSKLRKDKNN